jgi:glycosyltransferase involved in cell wall biosynthesis
MIQFNRELQKENIKKFSVLISVYFKDNPAFFSIALKSVIEKQTLTPSEVILVKDGPLTQQLEEVISTFTSRYPNLIKSITLKENKGLGLALREGLKHCNFDIVARMDSDDISLPNRFKMQMESINSRKVDIVGSNVLYFDTDLIKFIGIKKKPEEMNQVRPYAKKRNPLSHVSVMFRKQSVISVGSYENVPFFEDYWLWLKMLQSGKDFYSIQEPLVIVRYNKGMVIRRGGFEYARKELHFLKRAQKLGFLSKREYWQAIALRLPVRLIPFRLRKWFYSSQLCDPIKEEDIKTYLEFVKEESDC